MWQDMPSLSREISEKIRDDGIERQHTMGDACSGPRTASLPPAPSPCREHIIDYRDQVKRRGVSNSTFLWTSDNSTVEDGNWPEGYPVPGLVTFQFLNFDILKPLFIRNF